MPGQPLLMHEGLTGVIRHTAFEVHRFFGFGFLERVYENSLVNRLRKKGLLVDQHRPLVVHDEDGSVVGEYVSDLIVNSCVLIEVKAARWISEEHVAQLLNYLRVVGLEVGLLINFGASRLQVRRVILERASARHVVSAFSA